MDTTNTYKEEIFTKRVRAGKRTYFFDVKATKSEKDFYITITESKRVGEDDYEKHKIFLYKEDFEKFRDALDGDRGVRPGPAAGRDGARERGLTGTSPSPFFLPRVERGAAARRNRPVRETFPLGSRTAYLDSLSQSPYIVSLFAFPPKRGAFWCFFVDMGSGALRG